MARRAGDTRQRMLTSAVTLLSRTGTAGTTVDAVLAHSAAPRGSVYHHFPGGRRELLVDAVRAAGGTISGSIDRAGHDGGQSRDVLDRFAAAWRRRLLDSDYQAGCPVVALAVAGLDEDPAAAAAVAEVFDDWLSRFAGLLVAHGVPAERAGRLSALTVASIEGAVVLCRAQRSTEPLDVVVEELGALLQRTCQGDDGP